MPDINYSEPKVLRDEIESLVNAGASDAEIEHSLPLSPARLLGVIRLLLDEAADLESRVQLKPEMSRLIADARRLIRSGVKGDDALLSLALSFDLVDDKGR